MLFVQIQITFWTAVYRHIFFFFFTWQAQILQILRESLSEDKKTLADNATIAQKMRPYLKSMGKLAKKAMPFVQLVRDRFDARGVHALQADLEVDECDVLQANLAYLISTLGLRSPNGLTVSGTFSP